MTRKKGKKRWGRWVAFALLAALLLPVFQVGCVRFVDPPVTPLMALRRVEGVFSKRYSGRIQYRWTPLREVPSDFLRCVVALEDARFFQHDGIDWKEIEAARAQAKRKGEPVRGASTITMQCARSLFLWQGRSWIRKGIEAYYTVLMEKLLSKRRILELYVNVIEMGDGVYGIGAASRHYFRVPPSRLTRQQSALLAAMLPAPRRWDPAHPSQRLKSRQRKALRRATSVRLPP